MNIFFLDSDPHKCAKYHNDKHVVKMILETAQLLCGVHWIIGKEAPYKLSHKNHPSSIWVRSSLENYLWLCELGLELCKEYEYRYQKTHKSKLIIEWCIFNKPNIPDTPFHEPPQAMPEIYKVTNNSVSAYRNYYIGEKHYFSTWKNRKIPKWFKV